MTEEGVEVIPIHNRIFILNINELHSEMQSDNAKPLLQVTR